jgi:hypothetical protein
MTLPPSGYLSDPVRTDGEMKAALESVRDGIAGNETWQAGARLVYVSATQLRLNAGAIPLKVGTTWTQQFGPAVTLDATGLVANTRYYVYAYLSGGVRVLVASTTGYVIEAERGVAVKSDDPTRSLVGMIQTTAAGQFADVDNQRLVLSWFSRRPIRAAVYTGPDQSSTSSTVGGIWSGPSFLCWDPAQVGVTPLMWFIRAVQATSDGTIRAGLGLNQTTVAYGTLEAATTPGTGHYAALSGTFADALGEGVHTLFIVGAVTVGTATWYGPPFIGAVIMG